MIEVAACGTFEQGHKKCNQCYRNIGFYSSSQKLWETFNIINNICEGFINKDKGK